MSTASRWERRVQIGAHPLAYPLVRGIGRIGPVVRFPRVGVLVSDAASARDVLTDTTGFTKTGPGSPADLWTPVVGPSVLLNMEGEDHARLRRTLSGLFTPRVVRRLCERVATGPMETLRTDLAAGREVDLVPVVRDLAGAVICELVGLPATDGGFARAFAAATAVTSMVRLSRNSLTPAQAARGRKALSVLTEPAAAAFAHGDAESVPGRMRELGLSEREALGAVAAFVLTGTETLVSYVPRLIALAHDTGWLPRLVDEPDRIDDVVSEGLRFTVPSPVMLRSVAEPRTVAGVRLRPGERVVIATISAAKGLGDFDPDRPHPPAVQRIWFGAGPHFCIGMPLAHEEIRTVLDTVVDVGPVAVPRRKVARKVLIPAYRSLVIRRD